MYMPQLKHHNVQGKTCSQGCMSKNYGKLMGVKAFFGAKYEQCFYLNGAKFP